MIQLGDKKLTLLDIETIVYKNTPVGLTELAQAKIAKTYDTVKKAAFSEKPIYGVNTGFGALAEQKISPLDQGILQRNIILSHATGVGDPLDFFIAKTLTLLRLNTLVQGHSGASPKLIHSLMALLNNNCAPLVPKKGSVGASGDLAPLAHLGLMLLGIGDAMIDQKKVSAKEALKHANLEPLVLGVRDGLALINGTQAMASVGSLGLLRASFLSNMADVAAASSICSLYGHSCPFDDRIHALKPHPGQIRAATIMQSLIQDRIVNTHANTRTQDPYSIRCIPQVHGASKDVIAHVQEVVLREINAVTDNPLFFFNEDSSSFDSLSGGNFHGQHIALALDYLAMAIAELGNISERRIELMINPAHSQGLPAFLVENSGINSGFMMLHVTASALVSENKILTHPASTDSIPTSANREDHVSMGMNAANKLLEVIDNTEIILAIELMAAHQGLNFRPSECMGSKIKSLHETIQTIIPFRRMDGLYGEDLHALRNWLKTREARHLFNELVGHTIGD